MGGYAFGVYKKPCPNCGGKVKFQFFAGDHYDDPSFNIQCEKCEATFIREKWEEYSGNEYETTTRQGLS